MMERNRKKGHKKGAITSMNSNIAAMIILGIIIMQLLFGAMALLLGYVQFSDEFTKEYTDNAFRIAKAAESYISVDSLDYYLSCNGDDPAYEKSYDEIDNLCNKVNARFIYVIQPDKDYENITFIFNTVNRNTDFTPYEIGYTRQTTNDDYKAKYRLLYEGESNQEYVVRDSGFIESDSHITAMIPLIDSTGRTKGILCVQRQMEALSVSRRNYVLKMLVVIIALVIMGTFIYDIFLGKYIIKPIRLITGETSRFASDPRKAKTPLREKITSDNEIGQLADAVDKMESDTLSYIDNLTRVTAETQRIGTELAVASAIQKGMLNAVSPDRSEVSVYATMDPAKEVGGDFYDFFMIDDDHMCMVIADVSGKGVPASLFMAISKLLIYEITMVYRTPSQVLEIVNERICKNNKLDMFVTVWIGVLELSTGKVIASNAGHEYPAIYRSGQGFSLFKDKHGFVVGGMKGISYKDYEFKLDPGDALFVYTDGVPEATDSSEQLFGVDRMISALNTAPDGSPEELIAAVRSAVDRFVDQAPQFDDLTMLCVKYFGADKENQKSSSEENT